MMLFADTHAKETIKKKMPDITIIKKDQNSTLMNIVAVVYYPMLLYYSQREFADHFYRHSEYFAWQVQDEKLSSFLGGLNVLPA